MKNILVFPCGSEIALEIYRSLEYSKDFKIYGGSSIKDHGIFIYKNYINNIPFVDDINFIPKIKEIIKKYKINFIFPAHDSVLQKLVEHKQELNSILITSPLETCTICRSKKKTYDYFKKTIRTPKLFKNNSSLNFPVFVKPDISQGSKGAQKVNTKPELDLLTKNDPSLLIMEYLPGKEYTVDCFTNKNEILLFSEGRERKRISNGISVNSIPISNPEFTKIAKIINKKLKLRGAWFFQLKQNSLGKLVLLEIAPRIAGTMELTRARGVNLPLLSLYDQMNIDVVISKNNYKIEIDRALSSAYKTDINYKNVYVDFDDTLIIKNSVNINLIKFLYQCKNNKKNIYLITKHTQDIKKTLEKYTIHQKLFKKIISLTKDQKKHKYVKKNSIFIDDSFSERYDVLKHINIPVFDLDTVKILIK